MNLIRTIALAVAVAFGGFAFAPAPAMAQGCGPSNPNCVVPDRPLNDSTSSAANTRFVEKQIAALPSSALDAICASNNSSLIRLSGTWQCEAYSAQFTVGSTLSIASLAWSLITGTPTTIAGYGITNARTQAVGNINYYVNGNSGGTATCGPAGVSTCSAGSDGNNCLTPATACLTLQNVFAIIAGTIDFAEQYTGTIYLAHNTGTTRYSLSCALGPWIGTSVIFVRGDSTDAAGSLTVITDPLNGSGLAIKNLCTLDYRYVSWADNASNNGAAHIQVGGAGSAGHLDVSNSTLGPMTVGTLLTAGYLGTITATGPLTISGGAPIAVEATNGGVIDFGSQTVTVSGTPAFSTAFAFMLNGGVINATNATFSGSATGKRCQIDGPLNVSGNDPNAVFPGNANCVQNEYIGAIGIQNGSTFGYGTAGQVLQSGGGSGSLDVWASMREIISYGFNTTLSASGTVYCWNQGCQASQGISTGTTPIAGTLKNLSVNLVTAPGTGQTVTATLYTGTFGSETSTTLTCQIAAAATSCQDNSHSVAISANQAMTLQMVDSSGATSSVGGSFGLEFDNP